MLTTFSYGMMKHYIQEPAVRTKPTKNRMIEMSSPSRKTTSSPKYDGNTKIHCRSSSKLSK